MSTILDIVESYFAEKGWPIDKHDRLPILRFEYEGENGRWFCYARVREGYDQFVFVSTLSEKVPEEKRLTMAEYITRVNFGLNIGNFEMDFEDGEIGYKTSIDVTFETLTFGLIEPLVKASFVSMDDYLPGIQTILAEETTAKVAFEQTLQRIKEEEESYDLLL